MNRTLRFVALAVLAVAPLAGCQTGASMMITGKVITGNLSFIGAVDPSDERLKGAGVEGATISARKVVENQAGNAIGEIKSGKDGTFKLPVKDQSAFMRQTQIDATKEGYLGASATMPFPPADRRLLVILKPEGPARSR